jgi:hypothetical protein
MDTRQIQPVQDTFQQVQTSADQAAALFCGWLSGRDPRVKPPRRPLYDPADTPYFTHIHKGLLTALRQRDIGSYVGNLVEEF